MRTTTLLLCLLGAMIYGGTGCVNRNASEQAYHLTILNDMSDSSIQHLTWQDIEPWLTSDSLRDAQRVFRIRKISANQEDTTHEVAVPAETFMDRMVNPIYVRTNQLADFSAKCRGYLDGESKQSSAQSSIWIPVCEELKILAKRSGPRTLILCSDLQEFTDSTKSYGHGAQEITGSPEKVIARFERQGRLPRLDGIHVVIIHVPTSLEEGRMFRSWLAIYTTILQQKHGAIVECRANLF